MQKWILLVLLLFVGLIPLAYGGSSYPGKGIPGEVVIWKWHIRGNATTGTWTDYDEISDVVGISRCGKLHQTGHLDSSSFVDCATANNAEAFVNYTANTDMYLTRSFVTTHLGFVAGDSCKMRWAAGHAGTTAIVGTEQQFPAASGYTIAAGAGEEHEIGTFVPAGTIIQFQLAEGDFVSSGTPDCGAVIGTLEYELRGVIY